MTFKTLNPLALWLSFFFISAAASASTYNLDIASLPVNITGKPVSKITINGSFPGPTLRWKEGEDVTINVTNHLKEKTAVHWHGLLVPANMDGVPGLNGFEGINPGQTFTYHFKIRQSGTYWYHAHAGAQEQDGMYGSIVISPKTIDPVVADKDYVVLLSDFSPENGNEILKNLKMDADYYNYAQRTVGNFMDDVIQKGLKSAWDEAKEWGQMRMKRTDLSDVSGYSFLLNGKTSEQNWTGIFQPGEKVRLRFINASSMSIYDVRIPGLKMSVVSADGQNVEPVSVDEFRFGLAETYDVIVQPKDDKAYTIVAEPIDRTGFALGTLATHEGMKGEMPQHRKRAELTMVDMGMAHGEHAMSHREGMDHVMTPGMVMDDMKSGWADAMTPQGLRALDYKDLHYLGHQQDTRTAEREITVTLDGNMERYIWTMDGKVYDGKSPLKLKKDERVRLKFVNETMMAHPMHLHGMFFQLENGQPADKLPNKHTVIVAPGQTASVLITADAPGEWALHCHLLYHMLAGMMNTVVVAQFDDAQIPVSTESAPREHHHVH